MNKGKDKLLSGMIREFLGQSHSALQKQGRKYIAEALKLINFYRGLSSVIGSMIGGRTGSGYNAAKEYVLGW